MTESTPLLSAFEAATEADLEAIRAKIAALDKERAALQKVANMLNGKLHGTAPKKPKEKVEERWGNKMSTYRKTVAKYLLHRGQVLRTKILEDCNIPPTSLAAIVAHEWFTSNVNGVGLTPAGKQAVG